MLRSALAAVRATSNQAPAGILLSHGLVTRGCPISGRPLPGLLRSSPGTLP